MTDVDDMLARHQRVREFVEETYPGRKVVEIREHAKSRYRLPSQKTEYVLAGMETEFAVEAVSQDFHMPSVYCRVALLDDGGLRIFDENYILPYP